MVLDGPSGNVAVVSEASLKPNDLAQPDIGRHSLTRVPWHENANYRYRAWFSGTGSLVVGLVNSGSRLHPQIEAMVLSAGIEGAHRARYVEKRRELPAINAGPKPCATRASGGIPCYYLLLVKA